MNQEQWELELLNYASQLQPQHLQHLARVHAQAGPDGVLRELAGTGLSRGALEVAASTIAGAGYEGAVDLVGGRLQEVAQTNVERRCGEWMAENGIAAHPEATSATQQVNALVTLAGQQGVTPIEFARQAGLVPDAAETAAQAERAKRGDGELTGMQGILEHADFHRAAAEYGKSPHALLKEMTALAEKGNYEEAAEKSGGLLDVSEAREILGNLATIGTRDRLLKDFRETDGEAAPERVVDPEEGWGLSEQYAKAQAKQPRSQRSRPVEIDDPDRYDAEAAYRSAHGESHDGMVGTPKVRAYVARRSAAMAKEAAGGGDEWGVGQSWDRESARMSGGDAAAAAYDQQQSTMSSLAGEYESEASAAEAEAA